MSREMSERDIFSIPRTRVGTPPEEGFFEAFTLATLGEIERRAQRRRLLVRRIVISSVSAAAAVAAVVWGGQSVEEGVSSGASSQELCYIENKLDKSLDGYMEELSTEDIQTLLDATESDDIFYSNL